MDVFGFGNSHLWVETRLVFDSSLWKIEMMTVIRFFMVYLYERKDAFPMVSPHFFSYRDPF